MSDLITCVNKAVQQGEISKTAAEDMKDFYKKELNERGTPASEAAKKAIADAEFKKQRSKYLIALSAKKKVEAEGIIKSHPDGILHGIISLLTKDRKQAMGNSNVEYRANAIMGIVGRNFGEALDNLRTKYGGFHLAKDKKTAKEMVQEILGKDTGNPEAKEFAGLWANIAEDLRTQFNAAGGDIRKLDDWGLPQSHNMFKINKAGRDEWVAFIKDKIDLQKMEVGDNVDEFLHHVFDTITTGGLNTLEAGKVPKGVSSARANAHREHRVLIFKDADDWINYQEKFGQDDTFNALTDHMRSMSNDIALLEILGPNPDNTFDYLIDVAKADMKLGSTKEGYLRSIFNVASGRVDGSASVTKGDFALEAGSGTLRSIQVASKLGSAVISSITDLGTMAVTAKMNDIPIMKTFTDSIKSMSSKERQLFESKLGLTMDGWQGSVGSRFAEMGFGKMQKMADFTLRASGIGAWTEGLRKGFSTEFLSMLGGQTKKPFNELNDGLKDEFAKRGISTDDWEKIRGIELADYNGAKFMSVENIMQSTDLEKGEARELSIKLLELVNTETDYAIIVPDARVRAWTTWGSEKGTIKGEAARTLMMFKSFPIAMITTHLSRGLNQKTLQGKATYLATLFLTTTVLGAMAFQMKNMIVGKDPKRMDEPRFWGAAIAQGGGVGIFGDFLFQDHTRYGNSIWGSLGGPNVGLAEDVVKLTIGNIQKAFDDKKESKFVSDAFNLAYKNIPAQNLHYTRLVFERFIKDQVNAIIGGRDYKRKIQRKIKKLRKEEDQEHWWAPNEILPSKAPELSKIIGE